MNASLSSSRLACRRRSRCSLAAVIWMAGAAGGCLSPDSEVPIPTASLRGQVLISGGVRGARISVDQLDRHGAVEHHIGEATTDEAGHFAMETGLEHGIFRLSAKGGAYQDLATSAAVQLDARDEIVSLTSFELLAQRQDALVSPIGHMIEARTMERLRVSGDLVAAFDETRASFNRHFGYVDWGQVIPWPLDRPAVSPTEPVRAAIVLAAFSVLASDIAADAQVGPQEVTVYRLMQKLTEDVRTGTFDGNDGDDRAPGSGLQLGFCLPVGPGCVQGAGCATGQCRPRCDLYSGTPRALLAGAMLKVIQDTSINRTGLDVANSISVVRGVSDDTDPNLFGASCIEALDRAPPSLRFDPPTPAEAAFVRGAISLAAVALDDIDPSPDASWVGLVDLDGDPRNAIASATLDTAAVADGPLRVVAHAVDLSGNLATLERVLTIDNTAPVVALDASGFVIDGSTWWTASAAPLLTGTVADAGPVSIKAVIAGGIEAAGVVSGASWTIQLPAGALDAGGTVVQIVAVDAAGNQSSVAQRLRPDLEPPVLSFQSSVVLDEDDEWVTFAADHSPQHAHTGMPIDLATPMGCPTLTKFSYLLGRDSPEYVLEVPGPNSIRYQLVTDDPGVGIAAGATEYRVGRRVGPQTQWVLDWTSTGNGVPIGTGVTQFPVGISSDAVTGLATTEGIYDVELRATDRLARTTTVARCFDLHLRAPPLDFESTSSNQPTKAHAYALDSLSLAPGAPYDHIAARLLNDENTSTGASLIDQDVFNGTSSTIYLTVTVTPPNPVMVAQLFKLSNALTDVEIATCGTACNVPQGGPLYGPQLVSTEATSLHFPAKIFELVGGVPTLEIPCLAPCSLSGNVFKFALPPRGGGQPARAFRIMTMIGQVSGLWPRDQYTSTYAPFEDTALTWTDSNGAVTTTHLTGKVDRTNLPERTGCVRFGSNGSCELVGTLVPYRALLSATLTFSSPTRTLYETAATASLIPAVAATKARPSNLGWTTSESTLP